MEILENISSQQSMFLAGPVRRAMKGCSFRGYQQRRLLKQSHKPEGRNKLCSLKTNIKTS